MSGIHRVPETQKPAFLNPVISSSPFLSSLFHLATQSYAGKYVPSISHFILQVGGVYRMRCGLQAK